MTTTTPPGELVCGWIAPHGVVSDMPKDRLSLVPDTNAAMRKAAEYVVGNDVESIVIVTPHGFRSPSVNTVSLCRHNSVRTSTWYSWRDDEMTAKGDDELGRAILAAAQSHSHPAHGLIYGATSESVYPIDWSITAPLSYLLEAGYEGSLLPVTATTGSNLSTDWKFGEIVLEGIRASGKRAAVIASSDLSHVHSSEGPYGQNPIAPEFDGYIAAMVEQNNLAGLVDTDLAWASRAAQDGLRSIVILGGAAMSSGFKTSVLAYEVLVYFGMLTALVGPEL